jgi:hypothetical protein
MFVLFSVRFWDIFHYYNKYSGKRERANDMQFCTQGIGIDLHQMEK